MLLYSSRAKSQFHRDIDTVSLIPSLAHSYKHRCPPPQRSPEFNALMRLPSQSTLPPTRRLRRTRRIRRLALCRKFFQIGHRDRLQRTLIRRMQKHPNRSPISHPSINPSIPNHTPQKPYPRKTMPFPSA